MYACIIDKWKRLSIQVKNNLGTKKNGIFAVANHNKHTNSNTLKHNTIQWHYCTVINP